VAAAAGAALFADGAALDMRELRIGDAADLAQHEIAEVGPLPAAR
jgi:hypothetical protein